MPRTSLAALAALLAVAIGSPAQASADQFDYVADLDANGIYYTSITEVIDLGKEVCMRVRNGFGPILAMMMIYGEGFNSAQEQGVILTSAANNMCPDIWPALKASPVWNGNGWG